MSNDPEFEVFWHKWKPTNGHVTETLSPFQMRSVRPFFTSNVVHRVGHKFKRAMMTVVPLIVAFEWAQAKILHVEEQEGRHHWD